MSDIVKNWKPKNFDLEYSSVWSFPEHGNWATHDSSWRGNWSPYIPRNIIMRYSKENDIVLDQFVGSGTTLVEAKLLNRNVIGVDVNYDALIRCKKKTEFKTTNNNFVEIVKGDARNLYFIKDNCIDLICTHPPYANIIKYSNNIDGDISRLEMSDFIKEIKLVAKESYRVLKKEKICAVLIGDIRKNGYVQPLGFKVMQVFEEEGFKLKEIVIKEQHNCKRTDYWIDKSKKYNFLLLAHEYLFVLKK